MRRAGESNYSVAEADGPQVAEHRRAHVDRRQASVRTKDIACGLPTRAQQANRLTRDSAQPRAGHQALRPLRVGELAAAKSRKPKSPEMEDRAAPSHWKVVP